MPRWDSRVLEPKVLCETLRQVDIDPVGDKQGDARGGHQLVTPRQNGSRRSAKRSLLIATPTG
jgi:hypothetical protein